MLEVEGDYTKAKEHHEKKALKLEWEGKIENCVFK